MTTNPRFALGVFMGVVALVVLFTFPADPFWVPLIALSWGFTAPPRMPDRESTKDASSAALTLCFLGMVLVFSLFLIPDSVWSRLDVRIPDWVYRELPQGVRAVPLWARLVLAAFWSMVTYRRHRQLERARVEAAV